MSSRYHIHSGLQDFIKNAQIYMTLATDSGKGQSGLQEGFYFAQQIPQDGGMNDTDGLTI